MGEPRLHRFRVGQGFPIAPKTNLGAPKSKSGGPKSKSEVHHNRESVVPAYGSWTKPPIFCKPVGIGGFTIEF